MKGWKIVFGVGALGLLAGLGSLMSITNPGQPDYEEFATRSLMVYLKERCSKAPFGLADQCPEFLTANQPQIRRLVAENTERHNFIFFSVYRTELAVQSLLPILSALPLPAYQVETVGAFQKFYIYEIGRQ